MIHKYFHKYNGVKVYGFLINFLIPASLITHLIATNNNIENEKKIKYITEK